MAKVPRCPQCDSEQTTPLGWARPRIAVRITSAELADRPEAGAGGHASTLIDPFDADSPLVVVRLKQLSLQRVRVTLETHHAVDDGWGQQLLLAGVLDLYGHPPSTTAMGRDPFDEYVLRQQELSRSDCARRFWDGYHMNPHYMHMSDGKRGVHMVETAGTINARVVDTLYRFCRKSCVQTKAGFFVAVCRAIAALDGDRHVTLGAVTNGRTAEVDSALQSVGLYWNILPFSMRVEADVDVSEELAGVHGALNEAAYFALYPLSQILGKRDNLDFRYSINFTNFDSISWPGPLEASNWDGQDRFHYPVNIAINIGQLDAVHQIHIVADDDVFPSWKHAGLIDRVLGELERIAVFAESAVSGLSLP